MFLTPEHSPYDWRFRLFGIDVRVHPLFWLGSAFLGGDLLNLGIEFLLLWMLAVFVSIVVHEMGHALAYRMFNVHSHIVLTLLCGLTVPSDHLPGRGRRIFVALAGPGAGFVVAGGIYALLHSIDVLQVPRLLLFLLIYLYQINFYWGLINLLPVWPLDGGRVSHELCTWFSWRNGRQIALKISVVVAGIVVIYSLACRVGGLEHILALLPSWFPPGSLWLAVLFGLLGYQSYMELQSTRWTDSHWDR